MFVVHFFSPNTLTHNCFRLSRSFPRLCRANVFVSNSVTVLWILISRLCFSRVYSRSCDENDDCVELLGQRSLYNTK